MGIPLKLSVTVNSGQVQFPLRCTGSHRCARHYAKGDEYIVFIVCKLLSGGHPVMNICAQVADCALRLGAGKGRILLALKFYVKAERILHTARRNGRGPSPRELFGQRWLYLSCPGSARCVYHLWFTCGNFRNAGLWITPGFLCQSGFWLRELRDRVTAQLLGGSCAAAVPTPSWSLLGW